MPDRDVDRVVTGLLLLVGITARGPVPGVGHGGLPGDSGLGLGGRHNVASGRGSDQVVHGALGHGSVPFADDVARGSGSKLVTGSPKSGKGRRIDLEAETVAVLRSWRLQQAQDRMALMGAWPGHGLVFTREDGNAVHPDYASTVFDRMVRTSGLARITFHGLRHSHASILLAAGTPVKVVSERLGHATVTITLDFYAHVSAGLQAQAVAVFADAMGGQ